MTAPIKRSLAVLRARDLLIELATKSNVDSPKALQERARSLLRHYPEPLHLQISSACVPEIWRTPTTNRQLFQWRRERGEFQQAREFLRGRQAAVGRQFLKQLSAKEESAGASFG